jgi:hypothetical protein
MWQKRAGVLIGLAGIFAAGAGVCAVTTCEDVDLNTGRVRRQIWAGPLLLKERIRTTDFSEYAESRGLARTTRDPRWRQVRASSLVAPISPHYRFHGTVNDIDAFMLIRRLRNLDDQTATREAASILRALDRDDPEAVASIVAALENDGQ